jgi:hypothetical protein
VGEVFILKYQGRRVLVPRDPTDCCPEKARYDTEIAARMGAQSHLSVGARGGAKRLWVYPCIRCHGWHLTRSGEQDRPAVSATQLYVGFDGIPPSALPLLQQRISR